MLANVYEQSGNRDVSEQCKYSLGTVEDEHKYIMVCVIHSWRLYYSACKQWYMKHDLCTYKVKIYKNFNNILSFLFGLKTDKKLEYY